MSNKQSVLFFFFNKDKRFDYYMLPFVGIKPVCHNRHKTVPEFIVILCDQMWMTII